MAVRPERQNPKHHSFNYPGLAVDFDERALKSAELHMSFHSTYEDSEFTSLVNTIALCLSHCLWQRTCSFFLCGNHLANIFDLCSVMDRYTLLCVSEYSMSQWDLPLMSDNAQVSLYAVQRR